MFKHIGAQTRVIVDRAKERRQSVDRWFMDREGTVHINKKSVHRKPLTDAEWAAINEAVRDFANNSREVH